MPPLNSVVPQFCFSTSLAGYGMKELHIPISPFDPKHFRPLVSHDFLPGHSFINLYLQISDLFRFLVSALSGLQLLEPTLLLFKNFVYIPKHLPILPIQLVLTTLQSIHDFEL